MPQLSVVLLTSLLVAYPSQALGGGVIDNMFEYLISNSDESLGCMVLAVLEALSANHMKELAEKKMIDNLLLALPNCKSKFVGKRIFNMLKSVDSTCKTIGE